jgi:acetyl-CoA C-acetyltransferase
MTSPALVASARVTQRVNSHDEGVDAVGLMLQTVEQAIDGAGLRRLAERTGLIAVPRGTWRCTDPGRVIAGAIGATSARTLVAEIGVLQHSLITRVCEAIARGDVDVAIVCGGETKYRSLLADRAGAEHGEAVYEVGAPDESLEPDHPVVSRFEWDRGIVAATVQYAMIESAYARAKGYDDAMVRSRLGALWGTYATAAAHDVHAWDRSAPSPDEIAEPSESNRMISYPYTKLLCSNWNVDQAAALVFASTDVAHELGVSLDDAVFPRSGAESNLMIPMWQRETIHTWPAFELASARALELAGITIGDVGAMEIYSCFPSAVQIQMDALGVVAGRPISVTGGMTFGGGPLNNFVLQATAAMADHIRGGSSTTGLVTGVSGLLTKPGITVWSASPGDGFRSADVTAAAQERTAVRPFVDGTGTATVVGATVNHYRRDAAKALAVVEFEDGSRSVAACDDAEVIGAFEEDNPVGSRVTVTETGRFVAG